MREEWRPAGFVDRLGADFIDGCLVVGAMAAAYFAIDRPILGTTEGFLDVDSPAQTAAAILWALWNWTYRVGRTGQSWGRQIAGLKVVDAEGDTIGFWRALGRNLFAMYVSAPLLNLGFFWVIWDPQKQAWHDKVFRTHVIRRLEL